MSNFGFLNTIMFVKKEEQPPVNGNLSLACFLCIPKKHANERFYCISILNQELNVDFKHVIFIPICLEVAKDKRDDFWNI